MNGIDIAYQYDGTSDGLMSCIFESFEKKEQPMMLLSPRDTQTCLFPARIIPTDTQKADRVRAGIAQRVCVDVLDSVEQALLVGVSGIDLAALRMVKMAFKIGPTVLDMLADPVVNELFQGLRLLWGEAHLLRGFIRFQEVNGTLLARISPKHQVLPLLREHFIDRYNAETFMIYDQTHKQALIYQSQKSAIMEMELLDLPDISDQEQMIRLLWQQFYQTIGIKERTNPRCRMTHMPKRFWAQMLEMEPELGKALSSTGAMPRNLCYNRGITSASTDSMGELR